MRKCRFTEFPVEYEARKNLHTASRQGQVMAIDHVLAEVWSLCGDVSLKPEIAGRLERLFKNPTQALTIVPFREYGFGRWRYDS